MIQFLPGFFGEKNNLAKLFLNELGIFIMASMQKTMYQWRTQLKSYPLPPKTQMNGRIRDQLSMKAKNRWSWKSESSELSMMNQA